MAKWHGRIGFTRTVETSPGVWTDKITEREYSGDVIRSAPHYQQTQSVNDDVTLSSKVSIIGDVYSNANIGFMKYVTIMGTPWRITEVELAYPRLILSIGGMYNGTTEST